MGWKFWGNGPQQTDAERSLAALQAQAVAQPVEAGPTSPAAAAVPSAGGTGFSMQVEDVFSIAGRGCVVTGTIAAGSIGVGGTVHFTDVAGRQREAQVRGIEQARKMRDVASAGEQVGLLLAGVNRHDVAGGAVLHA